MKRLIPLLAGMLMAVSSQVCLAKEPAELTTTFFNMVAAGKVSDAYDQLFTGSQIPAEKPQAVDALKRQTSGSLPLYGKILGLEKVREERLGKSIIRLVYVLKLEMAPTVWEFYFYRPKGDWILTNVIFSDQYQLLHPMS